MVEAVDENGHCYETDDFEHYVFERTMEAIYGPKVWDWYNKILEVDE